MVGTLGGVVALVLIVSVFAGFSDTAAVVTARDQPHIVVAGAGALLHALVVIVLSAPLILFGGTLGKLLTKEPSLLVTWTTLLRWLLWLPLIESITAFVAIYFQRVGKLQEAALLAMTQPFVYLVLAASSLATRAPIEALGVAQIVAASAGAIAALGLWRGSPRASLASFSAVRLVVRETARQWSAGAAGFLSERVDNLLVGGTLGAAAMGFYSFGWNASRFPIGVLSRVLRSALLPALASLGTQSEGSVSLVRRALGGLLVASSAISLMVFIAGREVTVHLMGVKWSSSGACLEIMAGSILLSPILFVGIQVMTAARQAHRLFACSLAQLALQAAFIPLLAGFLGERGAALVDIGSVATAAIMTAAMGRSFGMPSLRMVFGTLLGPPAIVALGIAAVARFAGWDSPTGAGATAASAFLSLVAFVTIMAVLQPERFRELAALAPGRGAV